MAGIYNRVGQDLCAVQYETALNDAVSNYQLDLKAEMRPQPKAQFLGLGTQPSFWGPLRGNRVTQESFLQGRGHVLSDCPDCGVYRLPNSLFPRVDSAEKKPACQRTDLQPEYTKQPRACNGLSELDTSCYTMFPGAFVPAYLGYNAVVRTNLQTRDEAATTCGPWY